MSADAQLTNGQGDAPQLRGKLGAVPAYAGRPAAPGSRADRTFPWQVSSAVVGERAAPQRSGAARVKPSAWRDRQGTVAARRSWERIGGWFVRNGRSNRISEVWDCHVTVLSLYGCDPLRQVAPE